MDINVSQKSNRKPDPYSAALSELNDALKVLAEKHGDIVDALVLLPVWRVKSHQVPDGIVAMSDPENANLVGIVLNATRQSSSFLADATENLFAQMGEQLEAAKAKPTENPHGQEARNID